MTKSTILERPAASVPTSKDRQPRPKEEASCGVDTGLILFGQSF